MTAAQQPVSSENQPQFATAPAPTEPARQAAASLPPLLERLAEQLGLIDSVLAGLVVVFALLLASFPARNSDFLMHAASGRLLAQGQYVFGVDPFSFTTEGVYWTNHSWLSDLVFYALYSIPEVGGGVVVLFKALLIALLAFVLIQASRGAGQSLSIPSACVALAVLVLSPRLLLQSSCISFLFLGLTLWLLQQPEPTAEESAPRWRRYWLLPPLFLFWVNCDEWFLLGPATVALYLLGELMHRWPLSPPADPRTSSPSRLRELALVLISGVAACLVNPHHVHAFTLPWELGLTPAGDALIQDPELQYLFGSPIQVMLLQSSTGLNIAAWAYVPLFLLGLLSFVLCWGVWRWWRVFLWLGFLALSLVTYRAVPFFAIVSAPILSLNLLDFLDRRYGPATLADHVLLRWLLGGRAALLGICIVLLVAAIPGWLHPAASRRALGLGVRIDPSLQQAALRIRDWREQGRMDADAGLFNTTPDVAYYLAWFCPGERSFMDLRLPLFVKAAQDFVTVRKALSSIDRETSDDPLSIRPELPWRSIFRKWDIRYLLFNTHDPRRAGAQIVEQCLMLNPDGWSQEWTLCYLDGRTMIAGWKDQDREKTPHPYADLRLDRTRLAFGLDGEGSSPRSTAAPAAPDEAALHADEAFVHALHYEIMGPRWLDRNRQAWEASSAARLSGLAATPGGPLVNGTLLFSRLDFTYRVLHGQRIAPRGTRPQVIDLFAEQLLSNYLSSQDSGPPASLFLTIRAARRALRENPNDAGTHFLLGEAYLRLAWKTRERTSARLMPLVGLIRQTQASAALERAVRLNPNLGRAHELLAELYENAVQLPLPQPGKPWSEQLVHRPNLEPALHHHREQLRCLQELGPRQGEPLEAFARRVEAMDKAVQQRAADVAKRLDQWELAAAEKPLLVRVQLALDQGLGETGLKELLQSKGEPLLAAPARALAMRWALELSLAMGKLDAAHELLEAETPQTLGMLPQPLRLPAYEWCLIQLAAADGDYAEADDRLAALLALPRARGVTPSAALAQTVGHVLLWEAPLAAGRPCQLLRAAPALLGLPPSRVATLVRGLEQSLLLLQQASDLLAVRGWLALETGDTPTARTCLGQVLDHCREGEPELTIPLRAGPLARLYSNWLKLSE